MGVMTKMRQNTAVVLYVLIFAFGGLWVLQDSGAFEALGVTRGRYVARVNGEPIDVQAYNAAVDQRVQMYQQQGMEVTPMLQARIENEVFEELVANRLREEEMDRLGVRVSEAEVNDLVRGENPDPLIRQFFGDGRGGIDRATLEEFIRAPENTAGVLQLEEAIASRRREAKLDALISAAARVPETEVEAEWLRRNRRASIEYVALRYADVPDAEVQVTDRDLRSFYDANREEFRRPRTAVTEYVAIPKVPSPEDSARAITELRGLRGGLAQADDPAAFARDNLADSPASYVSPAALDPVLADAVFSDLTVGRVVGPVVAGGEAVLARITDVRPSESGEMARARHVLFATDQRALAETVRGQIAAGELSFADAARQHSTDQSNSAQGGDLGWFGRGRMVAPFDQAVFAAPVGQVTGPVETNFGHHLILVEARTSQEAELVRITRPVVGSFDRLLEQADELRFFAEEEGQGFAAEARRRRFNVQEARVDAEQDMIPGLSLGRDGLRWLRNARAGTISPPFDTGDAYVVFHVTAVEREGYRAFDEVRAEIEPRVRLEKRKEAQVRRMREALQQAGGDLTRLAQALGTTVQRADDLTSDLPMIEGVGRAPAVVGTAYGLPAGRVSGVVEGEAAAAVVRSVSVTGGDLSALSAEERATIRQQLLQRRRASIRQAWMQSLRDRADVRDLRDELI